MVRLEPGCRWSDAVSRVSYSVHKHVLLGPDATCHLSTLTTSLCTHVTNCDGLSVPSKQSESGCNKGETIRVQDVERKGGL